MCVLVFVCVCGGGARGSKTIMYVDQCMHVDQCMLTNACVLINVCMLTFLHMRAQTHKHMGTHAHTPNQTTKVVWFKNYLAIRHGRPA